MTEGSNWAETIQNGGKLDKTKSEKNFSTESKVTTLQKSAIISWSSFTRVSYDPNLEFLLGDVVKLAIIGCYTEKMFKSNYPKIQKHKYGTFKQLGQAVPRTHI